MKDGVAAPARRRIGLREVARAAHTSVATVSRVLNSSGYIAGETRARVLAAVEELHYQPNLRAKGLRQQRSHTIGLLIPNLLNAYYTALADEISQRLNAAGYQLLLSSTRDDPAIEKATLRRLIGHDVDGLIWVPTAADHKLVDLLTGQNLPAVAVVRRVEGDRLDTIVFEDYSGARMAVLHLAEAGHRRIGLIGGDIAHSSNSERLQGYLSALAEIRQPADPALVKVGLLRDGWGSSAMDEFLCLPEPPTAVFIASNALMPGVMRSLHRHSVRIPDEISLICFDDLDWFAFSDPSISAISTSHLRIAEAAVNRLLERINHPTEAGKTPVLVKIGFELLQRGSVAAPNIN